MNVCVICGAGRLVEVYITCTCTRSLRSCKSLSSAPLLYLISAHTARRLWPVTWTCHIVGWSLLQKSSAELSESVMSACQHVTFDQRVSQSSCVAVYSYLSVFRILSNDVFTWGCDVIKTVFCSVKRPFGYVTMLCSVRTHGAPRLSVTIEIVRSFHKNSIVWSQWTVASNLDTSSALRGLCACHAGEWLECVNVSWWTLLLRAVKASSTSTSWHRSLLIKAKHM